MGDSYPEVAEHRDEIHRVLTAEEERFAETLERGMKLFDEAAAKDAISGDDAFTLQATYGFPLELTTELGRERGIPVDDDRARELMEEHREISRAGIGADGGVVLPGKRKSRFAGYEKTEVLTAILEYADVGEGEFQARLEESPFYAEGGGQVGDPGWIENEETGTRAELVRGDPARRRGPGPDLSRGRLLGGRRAYARSSPGSTASRRWRTTRRRTFCTRRCARCSATTSGRRAPPSAPTSSASTSPIRSP